MKEKIYPELPTIRENPSAQLLTVGQMIADTVTD